MRKRNKKAIIITAIVMFMGILLVLAGFFGDSFMGLFARKLDYENIKPEDIGKSVEIDTLVYYDNIDLPNKETQFIGDVETGGVFIVLDLISLSEEDRDVYYSNMYQRVTIRGKLIKLNDDEFERVKRSLFRVYDKYYENHSQEMTLDEFHELLIEPYLPYGIKVTSIGNFNWKPFIPAGIIVFFFALVFEICFVFKLKKRIVLPVVFAIVILIPVALLFNHVRTILSIDKVTDGFYTLENYECTDTQGMLASDAGSIDELVSWIIQNHLFGVQFDLDEGQFNIGCATFAAVSPEGDHIFGRNFDYPETDTVLVHSHPKGAYESIGVADIGVLGVGQTYDIDPDSAMGKLYMIITPYMVLDGMNEKGLGVGILELDMEETHQDNGKPDLLIYCAIRAVLDNCATVDEAVELLGSYDIQSDIGATYHLFVTDTSGKYVVVEWLDNEMTVVEHPCCTNSVLTPGEFYDMGDPDERLGIMEEELGSDRVATEQEAMSILDKIHDRTTEWSCVYNLEKFTVSICLDSDYDKVYTFNAKDM